MVGVTVVGAAVGAYVGAVDGEGVLYVKKIAA
jgi:hypothetical protein